MSNARKLFEADESQEYLWDNPGVIYDRFGHPVDTSGDVWILTDPSRSRMCDWKRANVGNNIESMKAYIAYCIETKAPHTAGNAFYYLVEDERNNFLNLFPLSIKDLISILYLYRC